MEKEPRKLSQFMLFICLLMRCDPDILVDAPLRDHMTVLYEALLLFLVALISGAAWAAFWAKFLPLLVALGLGVVAYSFIFLIDQAIGAADWRLGGILRHPSARYGKEYWARLAIRATMTLVLSLATSTGAAMWMSGDAIKAQLDQVRREENQKIEDRYAVELNTMLQRQFGSQMDRIKSLAETVRTTTPLLDMARQASTEATELQKTAEMDEEREATGKDGRAPGKKVRYREAEARADAARADLARANTLVGIYQPRLQQAKEQLTAATEAFEAAKATIQPKIDALEDEKRSHLIPARQDALMSFMALQQIYDDPVKGKAARWFGTLMMLVLMTIELSYITIRIMFQQASIYMALLIDDTKRRAEGIDAKHENDVRQIRRTIEQEKPPPMRIIDLDAAPGDD